MELRRPAIALLELESLARGLLVADAVLKKAPVKLSLSEAVTPGKYLILFSGGVAEVEESFRAGKEAAGATMVDELFLPQVAPGLANALEGRFDHSKIESLGAVETHSVASALLAADSALKRAQVSVRSMQLARGIGGKGYFVLNGELHMIEAALEACAQALPTHLLVATEIISRPHRELFS